MEKRAGRRYRQKLNRLWPDVFFVRGIVALLGLIILIQSFFFLLPSGGKYLNMALRLEGEPIAAEELDFPAGAVSAVPWAVITLRLDGYLSLPGAKVFLNGRETASFQQVQVTLNVKDKDRIMVRNADPEQTLTIIVAKATPNIERPLMNEAVTGKGTIYLDTVIVK